MTAQKRLPACLVLLLIAACISFASGQGKKTAAKAEDSQTIRVNVEMVSLPVVVTTREGKRITDLTKDDFQIIEDGVPQEIAGFAATDEPLSIVLAIDTSGSTEESLARIQYEAIKFVNLLHPDDSVAILSFAQDVNLLRDFTIDRDKNAYGIKMTRSGGWTVLYEAVWLALEEVLKPVTERKALVLFTDGVDTASRKASEKDTLELAKESYATVYSVYFDTEADQYTRAMRGSRPTVGGYPMPGGLPPVMSPMPPVMGPGGRGTAHQEYMLGHNYLKKLAEFSGGVVVDANSANDLSAAFEEIARELASQYSIGYYSTNQKNDGKFRKVDVRLKKPGLVPRTKKGYFARKPDGKR